MKRSFTLIEVLVSIGLLSVVIAVIFQIKQNNLFYLHKFNNSVKVDQYIALATIKKFKNDNLKNRKIYLDEIVDFKDDDIRRDLKNIKISLKEEELDDIDFSTDQYNLKIKIIEQIYKYNSKNEKKFYQFRLQ